MKVLLSKLILGLMAVAVLAGCAGVQTTPLTVKDADEQWNRLHPGAVFQRPGDAYYYKPWGGVPPG